MVCFDYPTEHILIAVSKPLLTVFGIHYRLESCVVFCRRKYCHLTVVLLCSSERGEFSLNKKKCVSDQALESQKQDGYIHAVTHNRGELNQNNFLIKDRGYGEIC